MQLEKMTKIPDLLDIVRLSEKAESCLIKYEYLFHLVKMSDSVFSRLKIGDRRGYDNSAFSSCECDKSDYEHNAYSPSSSARWAPEDTPEYFVVAGKKPLSLVFKRSRSNSPVLKPKSCRSPVLGNKLCDTKAFSYDEHFEGRKNLDCEPQNALDHGKCKSSCVCHCSNCAGRNGTSGVDNEQDYFTENACPVKNTLESRELCVGGKHVFEDGDSKINNCLRHPCGNRKINSVGVCSGSVEPFPQSAENGTKLGSSGINCENKKCDVEMIKRCSEINSGLNVKIESAVLRGSSLQENNLEVVDVGRIAGRDVLVVQDGNELETPLESRAGIYNAEASTNVLESSKVYTCKNQKLLHGSVNSCNNYKSEACSLDVSTSSVAVGILQNDASLFMNSKSKASTVEICNSESLIPFSAYVNGADDLESNGQAMETFSDSQEITLGQLESATCNVVGDHKCSGEPYNLEMEISTLCVTDEVEAENSVPLVSVGMPLVPTIRQGGGEIGLAKFTKEINSQKQCNLLNPCSVQVCTLKMADMPPGELESVTTKTDAIALTLSEIADVEPSGNQACAVGNTDEHYVVRPLEIIASREATVGKVDFSELSVPILVNQGVTDDSCALVSENSTVSLVENCARVFLARDGVSGREASIVDAAGDMLHGAVECHNRDESEPMEQESYEALGSIEMIEHLRNPIDISPECVQSDEELEILEVKGRAAYCNVATASHNIFPWDLEKEGSFSFPGDELSGGSAFDIGEVADGTSSCGLEVSSGGSQNGPAYMGLSNDPFICGLSRDSDDCLSPGDGASGVRSPAVGMGTDMENACDHFLFEDKSDGSVEMGDGQFLCPVDMNGALPFGEVEVKDDRAFGGIGTGDGAQCRESSASDSCTLKKRRGTPQGNRKGKGDHRSTDCVTRASVRKCEQLSRAQAISSCDAAQVYGFSEETIDRIFNDSSGDVYGERSPLLYSSDEEKVHCEEEEERYGRLAAAPGAAPPCHEKRRLTRLQELVSGVPPPPTVTFPQFTIDTMVSRLRNFSIASTQRTPVRRALDPAMEDVAKSVLWPDSKLCSFHGITYNRGRLSEEAELLCQKLRERYVGSETASSLVGAPACPAAVRGDSNCSSGRRSMRGKGRSPGRRLSHLARRRNAFSSSSLLAAPPPDKRVILVDPRPKERSKGHAASGKRSGPEPSKVAPPCPKTGKRSLFQTPPNKCTPDAGKVSVNSSKPTRRALFKSPPGGQSAIAREPAGVDAMRRTLWPAAGALHGIENCAKEAGKRQRAPGEPESGTTNAKYLRQSSRTPTKGSENRGRMVQKDLSSPHRKKLLWAVAESLRASGVGLQHPRFRACAAMLARRCRDVLVAQPVAHPGTGSTSERMLHLANKHVQEVVRAHPT